MERTADKGIGLAGFGLRFAFALALVYASYNPWGISYVAWVIGTWTPADESSWFSSPALKFVVGTALAIAWVVYGTAARRSLGGVGILLIVALCVGLSGCSSSRACSRCRACPRSRTSPWWRSRW